MKPTRRRALCLLPLLGLTMAAAGWLRQWPLQLDDAEAGAYRLVLDEAVYRQARERNLRDVAVVDGEGRQVPAMLFAPDKPAAQPVRETALPWFPLPDAQGLPSNELSLHAERADDGRVVRVEAWTAPSEAPTRAPRSWLVDASALRRPFVALRLGLPPDVQVDARLQVEGSDDLVRWSLLHAASPILKVEHGGQSLRRDRIEVASQARYLRLSLLGGTGLPLASVAAEFAEEPVEARQWLSLAAKRGKDAHVFEFEAEGRQAFDRVDVELAGNTALRLRLESRDDPEQPWQHRIGPWTHFSLGSDRQSAAQAIAPMRQRHWRLVSDTPLDEAPMLKLGWQPEVLVFVASGTPPYRLVAGSAQQRRLDAPIDELLAQMRLRHGLQWHPGQAHLAGAGQIADARALLAMRDWKTWTLWAVLLLAVVMVIAFAGQLLRHRPRD
ncbi:DUF3999 domain-containing protein [Luteimonas sp. e5]